MALPQQKPAPRRVWRRDRPRGGPGYARLRVARGRVLLQTRKWYESPKWRTIDGISPTFIADWNNNQYALPAYGPELVSNGTFSGGTTGWSVTAGTQQVVGGELEVTGNGTGFATTLLNITLEIGKTYALTATARKGTANANVVVRPGFNNSITAINTASTTNVTGTLYFQAVRASETIIAFINDGASTGTFYVDNISVREVMLGDVGPELILNGDFSAAATGNPATGWQLQTFGGGGTAAISAGSLNLTGDGSIAAAADQSFTTEVGASYTIVLFSSVQLNVAVGTSQGGIQVAFVATNTNAWTTLSFVATTTTTWLRLSRVAAILATVDNVSVRRWTPRPTLRSATFAEMFTYTATSTTARTYLDQDGTRRNDLAANVPRFAFDNGKRQLQLENQSTNQIANGDGVGSVAGTPGTFPTGWQSSQPTGITRTIVGSGIENGIPYVEIRYQGTASSSADIVFDPQVNSAVTASVGQTWTFSEYLRLVSGGVTPTRQFAITLAERLAAGTFLTGTTTFFTPTTTYTRYTQTRTLTDATVARVSGAIRLNITSGDVVDITIRVGAAQLEAQTFASAYIPTTTAPVTRAVESAQLSPLAQAIVNRAALTVAVRGRLYANAAASPPSRALFGNDGSGTLLFAQVGNHTQVSNWNGASGVLGNLGGGTTFNTAAFGAVLAFDSGGRVVAANGGAIASDTAAVGNKVVTYLGRSPGSSTWGDGFYDNFILYPARVSNAAIPALAVAA